MVEGGTRLIASNLSNLRELENDPENQLETFPPPSNIWTGFVVSFPNPKDHLDQGPGDNDRGLQSQSGHGVAGAWEHARAGGHP